MIKYEGVEAVMESLSGVGLFCSIVGVSAISIANIFIKFMLYREYKKRFRITKKSIQKCTRKYVEPVYVIEHKPSKKSLTHQIKKLVSKLDPKLIFILGSVGSGKTILVNRFIIKYAFYFKIRKKNIVRIFGMECSNIVKMIEEINDKDNTILIIDGLEEAFVYLENKLNILDNLDELLLPFYKVVITMNSAFYQGNEKVFENLFYRNADQDKIFPIKIYMRPFSRKKIKKFLDKNLKTSIRKKQEFFQKAIKNEAFYSSPLMLGFIVLFDPLQEIFDSYYELLEYILNKGFEWDANKYITKHQSDTAKKEILDIMCNISNQYLTGKLPIVKTKRIVQNILLDYDEKEYWFQNTIFLHHSVVRNFYSQIPDEGRMIHFININEVFRRIYFEKIYMQYLPFLSQSEYVHFDIKTPSLEIYRANILSEKWLLGLTKSFLNYHVKIGEFIFTAESANRLIEQLIFHRSLDLQDLEIDEEQLSWWSELSIDKLNISNTKIRKILISDSWQDMHVLNAKSIPLEDGSFLGKLQNLKELDLSGVDLQKVIGMGSIPCLPDRISVDLSNCNITNENIPQFMLHTKFENLYLDYNKVSLSDFVYKMNYAFLNISNNPVKNLEDAMQRKKTICNYYFENEEIRKYFCGENDFLIYDQAVRIKEINVSQLEIDSLSGVESLPNLESITINTFQSVLIDNRFMHSPLQSLNVITYKLNQLVYMSDIYITLSHLMFTEISNEYDNIRDNIICLEHIMSLTEDLMNRDYQSKGNETFITGMTKMVNIMNADLSLVYRRIIDSFHYAADYWNQNMYNNIDHKTLAELELIDSWEVCARLVKNDYELRLGEICNILNIELLPPENLNISMLLFFHNMQDLYTKYIKHGADDMCKEISRRVGRHMDIRYF